MEESRKRKRKGGEKKVRIKRERFYHHLPADLEEELSSRTTLRGRGGEKKGEGEEETRKETEREEESRRGKNKRRSDEIRGSKITKRTERGGKEKEY